MRTEYVAARAITPARPDHLLLAPPALDESSAVIAPLMNWWAVLFALSMVARYEPSAWARHNDLDSGQYAVVLDELLVTAIDDVPHQILQALQDPTAWMPATLR